MNIFGDENLMKNMTIAALIAGSISLAACGNADGQADAEAGAETADAQTENAKVEESAPAANENGYENAPSGEYKLDKGHGYIAFTYSHLGYSKPILRWRDWDATLNWNKDDPTASTISVVINAASIDSGVDDFDAHLKSDDFFDVENHPQITFEATEIVKSSDTKGTITGDLVMMGQSHPVTLDVTFNKAGFQSRGNVHKIGFSATTNLLRSQWGLGLFAPNVSDEVSLAIEVEFDMPAEE